MRASERVVVVGNGIAGVTAADSLRAAGYDGELTLVGDEPHAAYSRPALSKALLRDAADLTAHELPPIAHGATQMLGVAAIGLDVDSRTVLLDNGEALPYEGLVVATGCRARRLGDAAADRPREVTLRTLDDAWRLRARIADRPSVLVVGGGPLGMEIASACVDAGCEVTLVSRGRPLARQLGPYLSDIVVSAARRRGLRIVTTAAARPVADGDQTRVVLADGVVLEADLVVTAAGDVPNVEWLATSGLLRDGVLEVDERGRVRPDVVAAGDVATVPTPLGRRRVPLWNAAIEQAKVAATALLQGDAVALPESRPYFWTEQFGLSVKAVGHLPLCGAPVVLDGDPAEDRALLRWEAGGSTAVVALNYRVPIPRLRRLCEEVVPAR
jgi:NADPH-dependent 2,4-dienoyl-CoA reductase/sulfur reductase-like enzyme